MEIQEMDSFGNVQKETHQNIEENGQFQNVSISLDILIPSVFGKTLLEANSMILKHIMKETESHIELTLNEEDDDSMIVSITGTVTSKSAACKAIFNLFCRTEKEMPVLKIKLPTSYIGEIIGFKGHSLNKIGKDTNTHLSLNDETVVITGSKENICNAQNYITSIIENKEEKYDTSVEITASEDSHLTIDICNDKENDKDLSCSSESDLPKTVEISEVPCLNDSIGLASEKEQQQLPDMFQKYNAQQYSETEERLKRLQNLINNEKNLSPSSWTIENIKKILSTEEEQQLQEKINVVEKEKKKTEKKIRLSRETFIQKSETKKKMQQEIDMLKRKLGQK